MGGFAPRGRPSSCAPVTGSACSFACPAYPLASLYGVLRFWDDRTSSPVDLALNPSVPLRVYVDGASCGAEFGLRAVRVLLVADVLVRIAELSGLQVVLVLAAAGQPPAELEQSVRALGLHPPTVAGSAGEAEALLGGRAHVRVAASAASPSGVEDEDRDGVLIGVGPADDLTSHAHAVCGSSAGDPLAVRLALLRCPYRQTVKFTETALAEAGSTVSRWRHAVATWAAEPSRPVPAEIAHRISVAFDNDLDTAAALDVLLNLESDREVPAGGKFETFAFADRVLGLELVREIGR
jgi:hypothetical protein